MEGAIPPADCLPRCSGSGNSKVETQLLENNWPQTESSLFILTSTLSLPAPQWVPDHLQQHSQESLLNLDRLPVVGCRDLHVERAP